MHSRRLEGLKLLKDCYLPTPEWVVVNSERQIQELVLDDNEFGWTIRTCRSDGLRETGGFFKNNLLPLEVRRELHQRAAYFNKGEFYIVYSSWSFFLSFNIVRNGEGYIVEGKHGSQKEISMGSGSPEICLKIPFGMHSRQKRYIGKLDDKAEKHLRRVLGYCRHLPLDEFYLEVAITTNRQIMFYELFPTGINGIPADPLSEPL